MHIRRRIRSTGAEPCQGDRSVPMRRWTIPILVLLAIAVFNAQIDALTTTRLLD